MKAYVAAFLCLLFCHDARSCESDGSARVVSKETVELRSAVQEGSFYYRVGQHAIFVDRHEFTAVLEKALAFPANGADQRLSRKLHGLPSTGEAVDAFALGLDDPSLLGRIELHLAALLERGEATVINVYVFPGDSGRVVQTLTILRLESSAWEGRQFCTSSGEVLWEITDVIV